MGKKIQKKLNEKSEGSKDPSEKNSGQQSLIWISWPIFIFSMIIVLLSIVSVMFPTLIASSHSSITKLKDLGVTLVEVDPFELGVWAWQLIIVNVLIFGTTYLYFKKKLPDIISRSIDFVFNFEISKKIAFIVIVILLAIYVGFSFEEVTVEEEWEDYAGVKQRLERWSPEQITTSFEPHVKYFLHWSSMVLFGYYSVIPFFASISLLILTYFFTFEITKKRFAGIVSMVILLQSNLFLTYDTTVSYTNFWILFFLLSLYFVIKVWPLSLVAYLISIPSKALTAVFLPMMLFFVLRSRISKNRKIIICASSIALILIGISFATILEINLGGIAGEQEDFDADEFLLGITSFSYQLRFDGIVLLFILPLIVGLFIASRHNIYHSDSLMVLISGILLIAPMLTGFSELTNQPYRFVPLVTFFAIGVGVLLSKIQNN